MQEISILELDRLEKEKDIKEEVDVRENSRLPLFLPKLIRITLIISLSLFLAGLVYGLAQYYLTGGILYFLPEARQVLNFVRSRAGFFAMGAVLAMIVFALRVIFEKKNETLNDEQATEAEDIKMFQAMTEIEGGETPEQVIPLPIKKKALKKIYGKSRGYPDYNSGQRGNVVMFKQKRPPYQRRAYRPKTPRVATAANRIKWTTQIQTVNHQTL